MIILSICISTFNRSEKVYNLVREILKYNGNELEVCVSDNCSTDDTKFVLSKIEDSRFHYFENRSNIGAIPNYLEAMSKGKGEYILFSTDKDSILSSGINDLVEFLRNNPSVLAGFCALDLYKKKENIVYKSGVNSLRNIGYLSKHPTGYFFNNSLLNDFKMLKKYSDVEKVGAFPFEFILADFCMLGKTAIVNIPLFYMETIVDIEDIKSYSYSGNDNNLYFSPYQRYIMFERYLNHLMSLNLSMKDKRLVVKWIYNNSLNCATFAYKIMIENISICKHYKIRAKELTLIDIFKIDYKFSSEFIKTCNYTSYINRIYICLEVHFIFVLKKIKLIKKIS